MRSFEMPVVSVVVPVYNVAAYLPQCLRSLTEQTLSQIEIICIDDGSGDDSRDIVRAFRERDPRVILLEQAHQGVSAARNLGIETARGKYIAFADSDDWMDPDMLRAMVACAEAREADVAICSAAVHFDPDCTDSPRRRQSLIRALTAPRDGLLEHDRPEFPWEVLDWPGAWPFIWNKLIRADLLRDHQIRFSRNLALGEDGVFLQLVYHYANRAVSLDTPLYHYRYQRKDSATRRLYLHDSRRFEQHVGVVDTLAGELRGRGLLDSGGGQLLRWACGFLYADFMMLPGPARVTGSCKFREACGRWDLAQYGAGWTGPAKRRLKQLLETTKECPQWKRTCEIVWMKVENRLIRMLHRA